MSSKSLLGNLTIIEYKLKSSVKIGNLFVPVERIEQLLSDYCTSLHVLDESNLYSFSLAGSVSLFRIGDRYVAVLTSHQIKGQDPEKLAISGAADGVFVTSAGLTTIVTDMVRDSDKYDFAALDFSDPVEQGAINRHTFLDLHKFGEWQGEDRVVCFLAVGFAYQDQIFHIPDDYHETGKVDRVELRKRIALYQWNSGSFDESVFVMKRIGSEIFNSDGMSGGPVFALIDDEGSYSVRFAGMSLRGGDSEFLRALKAPYVSGWLRRTSKI